MFFGEVCKTLPGRLWRGARSPGRLPGREGILGARCCRMARDGKGWGPCVFSAFPSFLCCHLESKVTNKPKRRGCLDWGRVPREEWHDDSHSFTDPHLGLSIPESS